MASRISQMRNGALPPQQMPQQSLSDSIEHTRALMQQMQSLKNPETIIMNVLQQNPQLGFLSGMLRNGNSLEGIANQIAQAKGYDINQVINQLQGGM